MYTNIRTAVCTNTGQPVEQTRKLASLANNYNRCTDLHVYVVARPIFLPHCRHRFRFLLCLGSTTFDDRGGRWWVGLVVLETTNGGSRVELLVLDEEGCLLAAATALVKEEGVVW